MIQEFKTEFGTIATAIGATFTTKKISELEDYVQNYDFATPLINLLPIDTYKASIGFSSQVIYDGTCKLYFLTKATKSDNFETTKDALIDTMITLSESFYRNLDKNTNLVFNNPRWEWTNKILREFTANYLVGVESTIVFQTACNRL